MLLSIIAAGKNDGYAGNFLQRVQFNIEKLEKSLQILKVNDVEIILVDWGSETRLSNVLNTKNFKHTKFLYVTPDIAKSYSPDNGFSSVHALNSGARRSLGEYVFFIDGDSYLPHESVEKIYNLCKKLSEEKQEAYYWASRYHLPYEIHSNCNSTEEIDVHVHNWIENGRETWEHQKLDMNLVIGPMGLMLSRNYINQSTCYYEKLNKWGYIEIEFFKRVKNHFNCNGDLENLDMSFFHLDHHTVGKQGKEQKFNKQEDSGRLNANSDNWGLNDENLEFYKV
jgi:glycosyltransferase involved in cell wall biosynthesis